MPEVKMVSSMCIACVCISIRRLCSMREDFVQRKEVGEEGGEGESGRITTSAAATATSRTKTIATPVATTAATTMMRLTAINT